VQSVIFELSIKESEARSLQDAFEEILEKYDRARQSDPFGRDHPLWKVFAGAQKLLSTSDCVAELDTIKVDFSVGQGNWAKVPWIALLDERETDSTQHGVYPVYLFRQDGSGVYLTIAQGVTEPRQELSRVHAREGS
jgi:hypothetical protein